MSTQPHILFVDDDPDICDLVQAVLQGAGFRVSTADSGASALQLAARNQFDSLLLDYWMPDMTGIELCRRIRAFDQSTPILICSGAVTQSDREAAVLAGAQGYVSKPFYSGDLIQALRSSLTASTNEDRNYEL